MTPGVCETFLSDPIQKATPITQIETDVSINLLTLIHTSNLFPQTITIKNIFLLLGPNNWTQKIRIW